jgi:hypothetical protein
MARDRLEMGLDFFLDTERPSSFIGMESLGVQPEQSTGKELR